MASALGRMCNRHRVFRSAGLQSFDVQQDVMVRETVAFARRLRRGETDAEALLWRHLRNRNFGSCKFRRQHPLGRFVIDFACAKRKVAIELDGGQHGERVAYDLMRTEELRRRGWMVMRFWNDDVLTKPELVLEEIGRLMGLFDGHHPGPLPQAGEGDRR
jgi:very-short-patch-repair endonuclease